MTILKSFKVKTNRGVVINKNRALYYFTEINPVDILIVLEEDTQPNVNGWEEPWIKCTEKFGHINYCYPWFIPEHITSKGTDGSWSNPHGFRHLTGQVHGLKTKYIKEKVGYLNPEFKGYGHGHVEWTERFMINGMGGRFEPKRGYGEYKAINFGVSLQESVSNKDENQVKNNLKTKNSLRRQFVPLPWTTDEERSIFYGGVQ